MKKLSSLAAVALVGLMGASFSAQAYDANWKVGRIYYRSVCTTCHLVTPMGGINPSSKTKAEWSAYLQGNKHAKGKDTVNLYFSKAYRDSIKADNKAAAKFAETPENDLMEDVKAFLLKGAKDGDAPATCS